MKELSKKLCLLMIMSSLVMPINYVYAEGEETKENDPQTEEKTEEPTPTPSESPKVTPTPIETPIPTETPTAKSDDANLTSLKINGESIQLKSGVTTYEYIVKSDVSKANISATAVNKATIDSSKSRLGNNDLKVGSDNSFDIVVVPESGKEDKTITYTIKVTRATSDMTLKSLAIKGLKLNEVFDPEKYEYTSDITYNVTSITVTAVANDKSGKVTVTGNNNLKVGKNTVIVTVKNEANESKEYKIVVNRGTEDELNSVDTTIVSENSTETSEEVTSIEKVVETKKDDNSDEDDHTLRNVIVITSSVLLLLIASLGIYFYVKTGDNKKKIQKKIAKLKKKQAKIEEQLTGLMPIITEEQENEYLEKQEIEEYDNDLEVEDEIEEDLDDNQDNFEDTIEIDSNDIYEETEFEYKEEQKEEEKPHRKRVDKVFDEIDLDDLFEDGDE